MTDTAHKLTALLKQAGLRPSGVKVAEHPPKKSNIPFTYQDYHHPALKRLRRKYRLDKVVAPGRDEFEKMLLLRQWVHKVVPLGAPVHDVLDAEAIIKAAMNGGTFSSTHHAFAYMSCATALGWQARKLGADSFHGPEEDSAYHGVTEVWSNQHARWFAADATHDVHFEKGGRPLSALELRTEWLRNRSRRVETRKGPRRSKITPGPEKSALRYFWFCILSRNDFFSLPERYGNYRQIILKDAANKSHAWYLGKGSQGETRPHYGYRGMFLETEYSDDLYPDIGTVGLDFTEGRRSDEITVHANHFTPNFRHLEVERNGVQKGIKDNEFAWRLKPGKNSLTVRTVNLAGVEVPPASCSFSMGSRPPQ